MKFAFLVHSRNLGDLKDNYKFLKILPDIMLRLIALCAPPVLIKKFSYTSLTGKKVEGCLIGITATAKQLLENRPLALKKIIKACRLAEKKEAGIIGLGALTAPLSGGGSLLSDKVKAAITTGNALTVAVAFKHLKYILLNNAQIKKIAIVGATGTLGQAVTRLLAANYPECKYKIFVRTENNAAALAQRVVSENPGIDFKYYCQDISHVAECDLVVVATSASEAILHSHHLKKNAVVYDVTQPQNIDKETLRKRKDLEIIDGGLVKAPGLSKKLPFGLPSDVIFSCLGELILLALEEQKDNFVIGDVKLKQVEYISRLAEKHGLSAYKND